MLKIFSIYDSKAEAFIQPFFSPTTATAIRQMEQAVNDETTDFNRYSGDYTLFEIGSWNENKGEIITHEFHINLGLASTFLNSPANAEANEHIRKMSIPATN